jgi:hypothetical protein
MAKWQRISMTISETDKAILDALAEEFALTRSRMLREILWSYGPFRAVALRLKIREVENEEPRT